MHYLWNELKNKGFISEGSHEGYYSINDETFISSKDLIQQPNGSMITEAGEKVELIKEKNYIFEIT